MEADLILQYAADAGFDLAGLCHTEDIIDDRLRGWLQSGKHGDMGYLENHLETREQPTSKFPWLRSVLVLGLNYAPDPASQSSKGFDWSCYAWGEDYHRVTERKLRELSQRLRNAIGDEKNSGPIRWYVDTGPISERLAAQQAGLGWIGRNGMLINQQRGSYLFLSVILLPVELQKKVSVAVDRCGSCRRCIEVCPTDAIVSDRVVDSVKCISYLSIEKRDVWSDTDYANLHNQFYGCDLCQQVCPWNRFAIPTSESALQWRAGYSNLDLPDLIGLTVEDYQKAFKHSAMKRSKQPGLVRNAIAVAANTHREDCLPVIREALNSSLPGVPETAKWALGILAPGDLAAGVKSG